jgi:hypothetical protein
VPPPGFLNVDWRSGFADSNPSSFYSVTMSRSYKQGEEWEHTDSYATDDLLPLGKLLNEAHSWIKANPAKKQVA